MKKTFLKSVATGIFSLTLVTGCSMFNKDAAHKCSSNTCKGKKEVTDTTATKADAHSCTAKKAAAHKCSAAKKAVKKAAPDKAADDKAAATTNTAK